MSRAQTDVIIAAVACGGIIAGLAFAARAALGLSALHPVIALLVFAAAACAALAGIDGGHPFARLGPANHVTLFRAALTALLAGVIGELASGRVAAVAVAVALAVVLLDGVDGWLARRTRMESPFGARLDMEVDALLILVLAVLAWRFGRAGAWVLASGLLRYAFVAAGRPWPWMRARLPDSFRRKAICVVQIAALMIALAPIVPAPAARTIAAAGLAALTYSFLVDVLWLWRRADTRLVVRQDVETGEPREACGTS